MSAQERIGRLQALLQRVTSRAGEARTASHVGVAVAAHVEPVAEPVLHVAPVAAVAAVAPVAAVALAPEQEYASEDVEMDMQDLPTRPPPPGALAPPEVPAEMPEMDLPEPAIELQSEAAAQSDERIVAAKPVAAPAEEEIEEPSPLPVAAAAVAEDAPVLELAGDVDEVDEEEESAPASSRRPMGPPPAEVLEQKAFGEETPEPVIHTPPPESGKLPAAVELPSIVEAADYDNQDITGVHHTPPGERRAARTDDALAQSGEHVAHLAPEITHAAPFASGASDAVADVIGTANAFKPATFAELLDAALKL